MKLIDGDLLTGVYANYNLRLDQIKVYGFDYDFTLAHYTDALQPLIYDLAKKHLVSEVSFKLSILSEGIVRRLWIT